MLRVVEMLACPSRFLRDLDWHAQVVQERRVNVAELMPRHSTQPHGFGGRLQDVPQQLGFA
jgi:hypothetical protein